MKLNNIKNVFRKYIWGYIKNTKPLPSKDLLTYIIYSTDTLLLVLTKDSTVVEYTLFIPEKDGLQKSDNVIAKKQITLGPKAHNQPPCSGTLMLVP